MPPKHFITWPFIFQILKGEKLLLKQSQVKINIIPPKIKDLTVKSMWEALKSDESLLQYFPDACIEQDPPRNYFFCVISAIRPNILNQLLVHAETKYWEKQNNSNQLFFVSNRIMEELSNINFKQSMMQAKPDKKIALAKKIYEDDR